MDCVMVHFSSKYVISWFMTHLNNDKQTNSFVPQLSKRVRKCLTQAREHVWGINVAVSVSGNINKRGATCQAAQKEVNIWPDGVQGPIAPFSRDLDCLYVCVFETHACYPLCVLKDQRDCSLKSEHLQHTSKRWERMRLRQVLSSSLLDAD